MQYSKQKCTILFLTSVTFLGAMQCVLAGRISLHNMKDSFKRYIMPFEGV
jgi:hypothetical protein